MTFENFEKAQAIKHKLSIASANLVALRELEDIAIKYPLLPHPYRLRVNDDPNKEIRVSSDFITMAIKYYEQEVQALNDAFDAL